ncbi:hypothetical protein CEP52_009867 [Fusarium oligoseptatum]|uniref:Uncharacterized protein n=1 Tax=Fusarium oligoseptatum TaxID=2604345 RepID=A0A428TAY6_9HYPO|nr:hypothetical protein CEP52_009867 [Fusarium oligoseptatum]
MDDENTVHSLEAYCRGISEVLEKMPRCPHSSQEARENEPGRLCADCSTMQTKLTIVSILLKSAREDGSCAEIRDHTFDLLNIVREVCCWQRPALPELLSFGRITQLFKDKTRTQALHRNIFRYLDEPAFSREGLIQRCENLLKTLQPKDSEQPESRMEPDDHSRFHDALVEVLRQYTLCSSCPRPTGCETPSSWHPARVFLMDSVVEDNLVQFDVVTSSSQAGWWQDLCIKIPLSIGKKVTFADDNNPTGQPSGESLQGFCQILESEDHSRISLKLHNRALFRIGTDLPKHRPFPGTGMSLADVLGESSLLLVLYPSRSGSTTSHISCIALGQVNPFGSCQSQIAKTTQKRVPLKMYVAFYPEADDCAYDSREFIPNDRLIHRCPRIQQLALVLLQIGLGRPIRNIFLGQEARHLNMNYSEALYYLDELRLAKWESFIHKDTFTKAIEKCLTLEDLMGKNGNSGTDPCRISRRTLIYEKVVSPLEWLHGSFRKTNTQIHYLSNKQTLVEPEPAERQSPNTVQEAEERLEPAETTAQPTLSSKDHVENERTTEVPEMHPSDRRGFETAIFCALPLEVNPVEALFDHHYKDDGVFYGKALGDTNAYSTGVIGRHNVVLVHMPGMGKLAAAAAAACCRISFPKIKLAILVGVCGAVPVVPSTGTKINLGDVIISNGVIQYDFGRQFSDRFERKDAVLDSLGRAGLEVRSTLSKLKTHRGTETLQFKMAQHLERLRKKEKLRATYPITRDSKSSKPSYCRPTQNSVNTPTPAIHFGLIASGDAVMKSADHRDGIASRDEIIAFEMEGAAVWEIFPCLVIKGVCDYADSLKNKGVPTLCGCNSSSMYESLPG